MSERGLQSYLLVVDSTKISLTDAIQRIDDVQEVENWQKILPDAAILVSRLGVFELNEIIKNKLSGGARYILVTLESGKKQGWLAKSAWEFMNNPRSVFDA
jgi:hypothetical protein